MKETSEVIVVGGGPSGSFAALKLAELGLDVTVYEEHSEIGIPSHCAGHLSIKGLKRLGTYPLPSEIVENTFHSADFYSPSGKSFSVKLASPVTCAVDRTLFDKHLAQEAEKAGANYCLDSRVESLVFDGRSERGVIVRQRGETERRTAKIVVDAEGISSRILREAGLKGLNRQMLVNGIEAEAENVKDMHSDTVEVYFGAEHAPGFYAWLMPKKGGKAKVGLAARTGNPKEYLQKFMTRHPVASEKLGSAQLTRTTVHPITLGGPIPKAYANGFLAVGDAASQVKSTTGGGVIFGMTCAKIAAEVVYRASCQNDFSSESLSTYQEQCDEAVGFDAKMMVRIRRTLDALSDKRLDTMIAMCARFGLEKTLQNVEDIDPQGRTLLHVVRSPRMFATLGYFFFTYLSANL